MRRSSKASVKGPPKEGRQKDSTTSSAALELMRKGLEQSEVHVNVRQQMIVTTEDRLRLCLNTSSESTARRNEWHAPAGIFVTELAACVTSNFHDALGISGQQWEAVFGTLFVVTGLWLVIVIGRSRIRPTADSLIESLKTGQDGVSAMSTEPGRPA